MSERMEVRHNQRSLNYLETNKDEAYQQWLESIQSRAYQKRSRDIFLRFLKFLETQGFENPTGDSILKQHKANRKSDDNKTRYQFDDLIPKFSQWLIDTSSVTHNSAVNLAIPIQGFFKFHREPLKIQQSDITKVREVIKKFHIFTQLDLAKMVRVSDVQEKAVILLGKDLGIRVGDFSELKRKPILEAYKNQNGEFPIEFEILTEKEGIVSIGHIMEETYQALQDYWSNAPQSEYVFPIKADRINDIIKNTWDRAFPDRNMLTRFHELRSFKMTALSDVGVNEWHIKKMVGKKLGADINTYLRGANLKGDFIKATPKLQLTGQFNGNNHQAIEGLQTTIANQQLELHDQKVRLDALTKEVEKLCLIVGDYQAKYAKLLSPESVSEQ